MIKSTSQRQPVRLTFREFKKSTRHHFYRRFTDATTNITTHSLLQTLFPHFQYDPYNYCKSHCHHRYYFCDYSHYNLPHSAMWGNNYQLSVSTNQQRVSDVTQPFFYVRNFKPIQILLGELHLSAWTAFWLTFWLIYCLASTSRALHGSPGTCFANYCSSIASVDL